jgi:hypothetical protein
MRRAATSGRALAALAGAAALLAFSLTAFAAGEARPGPKRFTITGSATGLYPGGVGHLALRVRNPYRRHLRVRALRVRVRDASRRCRASNLSIGRFRGFVDVRPRRTAIVRLTARLAAKAPAGCSGARFPLRFSGKGSVR